MCIALWALDYQDYSLVLCSNRDEFLSRPTQNSQFHNFEKNEASSVSGNILSGRDAKAGGTWLGVNRTGKVALLTNITEPIKTYSSSRGYLTSSFLLSDSSCSLEAEVGRIIPQDAIAGFNLLLLRPVSQPDGSLQFDSLLVTNYGAGGTISSRPLSSEEKSCGCISNAVDGTATPWPKVVHATEEFSRLLYSLPPSVSEAELTDKLFEILRPVSRFFQDYPASDVSPDSWQSPQPITSRAELRNTIHVAPLVVTQAPLLAADANVLYGTRLSTILLVKKSGEAVFIERDIWQLVDKKPTRADPQSQRVFRFRVDPHGPAL